MPATDETREARFQRYSMSWEDVILMFPTDCPLHYGAAVGAGFVVRTLLTSSSGAGAGRRKRDR
jgi:hypothetical protein